MEYKELDDLIHSLKDAVESTNPQKGYWKELWSLVKEINSGFKETHYPTRDDRDKAWSRFQELVTKAKERGQENKARIEQNQRDWERKQDRSRSARNTVISRAERATPLSEFERSMGDIFLFPAKIIADVFTSLIGINSMSSLDETRRELLACNEALQEAWKAFNDNKKNMLPGDRNQAYESLQDASRKLDEAWRQWKERNSSLREQRQREWDEKHRSFVERVNANIAKLEEKLAKAEAALQKQEAHLDDLREKYDTAWNDSYRERCSDWIDECESRISSIKEHIDRLEGWINEERKKLD